MDSNQTTKMNTQENVCPDQWLCKVCGVGYRLGDVCDHCNTKWNQYGAVERIQPTPSPEVTEMVEAELRKVIPSERIVKCPDCIAALATKTNMCKEHLYLCVDAVSKRDKALTGTKKETT